MTRPRALSVLIATLLCVNIFVWYAVWRTDSGVLTVAYLDIGQGDAIYIETPGGSQMLIDGGPGNALMRELGRIMPFYDRSIDVVLVSNPDKDHIEGFVDLLDTYKVALFVEPGTVQDTGTYKTLKEKVFQKNIPTRIGKRGMNIILEDGISFNILFPDRGAGGLSTNTGSIVGELVYGNTSFFFTGDAPDEIEEYLALLDGERLKSDVLKVGHHGSRTSTSPIFLDAVNPRFAVISSGEGNRYGHPHTEVLENLAALGAKTLRTDREGTVVFKSDGRKVFLQ